MKLKKNGGVRLESGEVRVGNFFARDEGYNGHVSLTDVRGCFKIRILKKMRLGAWLEGVIKLGDAGHVTIQTYVATMWSLLAVIPDDGLIKDILKAADDALHRHPDWYGVKPDADSAEIPREDAEKEVGDEG